MRSKIKRFKGVCIFIVFAILTFYSSTAFSAVPEVINYQGSLSDAGGSPINATLNITFTLYDVDAGPGTILWQEVQSVTITNGQFSAQLGADGGNLLPEPLDDPLFLGVQIDTDAEMTPRQRITSTAFALKARTVESDTLNSLSCAANEIPKFIGGVWTCAVDDGGAGDITGVTAGNGLTGGGLSGDVNVAVDTNIIQNRVSGTCAVGSSIRSIAANGTVTCEIDTDTNAATLCANGTFLNGDGSCDPVVTDTDTTYSAGSGLSLIGTTFLIPTNGVNANHLAANSVGTSEVANNSLTADDLGTNSVGSLELAPEAVGVSELSDLARGIGINGVIVIPASAFQPDRETGEFNFVSSGYVRPGALSTSLCLQAPVALPDGVTVTHFEISVFDNSVTNDTTSFVLRSVSFTSGSALIMGSVGSNGTSNAVRVFEDNTILSATVNAFSNSYQIYGCITADAASVLNLRLYGARIRYN